jgi:hypothetical protein
MLDNSGTTIPGRISTIRSFLDKQPVQWTLALITFAFVFVYHTYPLGLSDFWWHLNTGRWIWNNGGMPTDDPFLYSSPSPLDARASLILRGYPLSQLLMLGIYNLGGIYALVILKGVLMTVFYGLLWNHFRRNGLHPVLALAAVAPLPLLFFRFDELRPQVFSFIGALLVVQLAEYVIACGKQGKQLRWYVLASLPLVMLFWANLHRGFIIGVGILLVYFFAEWVARMRDKNALSDSAFRRFLTVALVSAAIAFFNPVGLTAMWASFTEVSGPFSQVIDEFFGTLKYFEFHGMKQIGYLVVAVAVVPSLALLFKWRQLSVAHLLILVLFLAAGILSFRFSLMMVAVVLAISCFYFACDLNRWLFSGKGVMVIALWCISTGFLANQALSRTSLASSPLERGVIPVAAVDYLAQANLSGNIYNPFEYGGYLSWRLYPRKVFIDPRNLSWDVYEEYTKGWRGNYAEVFNKYQVGAVFYPIYDGSRGGVSRLVAALLNSTQWEVGYYDGLDIILVKSELNSNVPFLSKRAVIADILSHLRR